MFRLVQNEWIKVFKRPGTYVMIGLLLLMVSAAAAYTKYDESKQKGKQPTWEEIVQADIAASQKELKDYPDMSKEGKERIQEEIKINEYRLAENVPVDTKTTMWSFVEGSKNFIGSAGLFMIIIAAGIVASEYNWGTIKLLLIRPLSRSKILFSKYVAVILFGLLMISILFVFSSLVGAILFGTDGETVHLTYESGKVVEQSLILYLLKFYLLSSIDIFMIATMAFMISAVFRNSSLAIGISLFLLFMGANVTMLIAMKYDWAKYSLFANTNLMGYETGQVMVEGMTLQFSLVVLAVYFMIFHLLAFFIFSKRDVAA